MTRRRKPTPPRSAAKRAKQPPAPPPPEPQRWGPVETKVRQDLDALVTTHPMGEALAEMAFALAKTLDEGAGLATAAVNRELRANLVELARMVDDDDDDLDALLSTPVRDAEDAGEEDPGAGGGGGRSPTR